MPPATMSDATVALRDTAAAAVKDYVEACIADGISPQIAMMVLVSEIVAGTDNA